LKRQWVISEITPEFLARMEKILHLYKQGYDPKRPVLCFDERPCFLIADVLQPIPMSEGQSKREHYEYEKNGSACVLLAFEAHTGKRFIKVFKQRTAKEYAEFMDYLEQQYPKAESITIVQDNLNTHNEGSFYKWFEAEKAFYLSHKYRFVFTPKKASWLNMAEIEFSALSKQCLDRRIGSIEVLTSEVTAWVDARNEADVTVNWQFSVEAAREKFSSKYYSVKT
jgi:DDE superfamily endonuclease